MRTTSSFNQEEPERREKGDTYDVLYASVTRANASDGIVNMSIFYGSQSPSANSPEVKLMKAVLDDALAMLAPPKSTSRWRHHQKEACKWIDDDDAGYLYSFRTICETLGFDHNWLRKGIQKAFPGAWG